MAFLSTEDGLGGRPPAPSLLLRGHGGGCWSASSVWNGRDGATVPSSGIEMVEKVVASMKVWQGAGQSTPVWVETALAMAPCPQPSELGKCGVSGWHQSGGLGSPRQTPGMENGARVERRAGGRRRGASSGRSLSSPPLTNSRRASTTGGEEEGSRCGRTKGVDYLGPGIPPNGRSGGPLTQSDVTRRPTITIHMVQGAWRRPRPTLQKSDQSARGPGESPFWKDRRCPCSAGGCMSHEWRRCCHWATTAGKGRHVPMHPLGWRGIGTHEGGLFTWIRFRKLRSLMRTGSCTLERRNVDRQAGVQPGGTLACPLGAAWECAEKHSTQRLPGRLRWRQHSVSWRRFTDRA